MLYFPAVVRPQGLRIIKIQFKLILKTQNKFGLKITKKKGNMKRINLLKNFEQRNSRVIIMALN